MDEALALKFPSFKPLRVAKLKLNKQSRELLRSYFS